VRLTAARRWLEEVDTGNWLLVLDNVSLDPEPLDFLRRYLPHQNGRGSILFTTRTKPVAHALAGAAKDGVELFLGYFEAGEIDAQSPKIKAIVAAVGCLPLAIAHAAEYLKQSCNSLDDILELYQSKHKIDVSHRAWYILLRNRSYFVVES
jgi:hypothetical protein